MTNPAKRQTQTRRQEQNRQRRQSREQESQPAQIEQQTQIERQLLELLWTETKMRKSRMRRDFFAPLQDRINGVVPPGLALAMEDAFFGAFQFVFRHGTGVIETTFPKKKLRPECDAPDLARLERRIKNGAFINTALATIEGSGLGLIGLGLPDIPLLLGMLLRNVYEIALRYGFSYENKGERVYILTILDGALVPPESPDGPDRADDVAERLDMGLALHENEQETMRQTARTLARATLVSKFIQGYPLIGVTGGWANNVVMRKISDYAALKYRKRFLRRLRRREKNHEHFENGDEAQ